MMTKKKQFSIYLAILLISLVHPSVSFGAQATVATAANFTLAIQKIADAFHETSPHRVVLASGSTGKLYAQIINGAPFDVYLAADAAHPEKTLNEGFAVPGTRFTYAKGKIVLYSKDPQLIGQSPDVLNRPDTFRKLAIANPKTAPYGVAAVEAMKALGVYDTIESKLVRGDNIAQTHQFTATQNAQLGFVALAQVINDDSGSRWGVPDHLYSPIRQDAVLLKRGEQNEAAVAFLHFLKSDTARTIIKNLGYGLDD